MPVSDDEWLPAMDAAKLLARKFGGLTRAQHAIATGLREGMLCAVSESGCFAEGEDAPYVTEEAGSNAWLEIPAEVWVMSDKWDSDRLAWDWLSGIFEVESVEMACDYTFYGVHFLRSEIETVDPNQPPFSAAGPMPETEPRAMRRGPKPSIRWAALIQGVLTLEREGKLLTNRFGGPTDLRDELQLRIDEDKQLDDRTIEAVVSYIYEHLLQDPSYHN